MTSLAQLQMTNGTREDWQEYVAGPGKYEGESPWTAYYHEMDIDPDLRYDFGGDSWVDLYQISPDDCIVFPELSGLFGVAIEGTPSGFVLGTTVDTVDEWEYLAEQLSRLESAWYTDTEEDC